MLIKLISQIISQQQDSEKQPTQLVGSGTKTDPYYWYGILDETNPNGKHTKEFNQNYDYGWVRVKLEAGTSYIIGQTGGFDTYLKLYDETGNYELNFNDDNNEVIDGVSINSMLSFMPEQTGIYLVKADSYNGNYPDNATTLHIDPAPLSDGYSDGVEKTPHNLTANDSDPRYILSQSSDIDGTRLAYKAMDGFNSDPETDCVHTSEGYGEWWKIEFTEGPVKISSFTFTNRAGDRI